jgi:tRNA splicing endonuclease
MSLTSFLDLNDVKEKFKQEFSKPSFKLNGKLLAPPKTNRHSWIGEAFDYLLRFYLKRIYSQTIETTWVAEHGFNDLCLEEIEEKNDENLIELGSQIIKNAKNNYEKYLNNGKIDRELIKSSLELSQMDIIIRADRIVKNFGKIDQILEIEKDIEDLENLLSIIPKNELQPKGICILNPTFGKASELVGGADADLIIDNMLIDIKTIKELKFEQKHLNQLIGYYILYKIGGIDEAPKNLNIDTLGIYYSRYGILLKIPVKDIIDETKLPKFMRWFKRKAKEKFIYI